MQNGRTAKESTVNQLNLVSVCGRIGFLVFLLGTTSGTATLHALFSSSTPTSALVPADAPDFLLTASTPPTVSANGTYTRSLITVTPLNFYGRVSLSDLPPQELTCLPLSPGIVKVSGESSLFCASTTPGSYQVTITGTGDSLSHTTTATFTFTPIPVTVTPDIMLSTSSPSLSFNGGASGTLTITVSPLNDFIGTVAFSSNAPAGVSCNFSPTSIRTSGTSVLTCSSSTGGDYNVTITATGGATPHSKSIAVHVAAASPAPPAPSITATPAIAYGIAGGGTIALVVGTIFMLIRSRRNALKASEG